MRKLKFVFISLIVVLNLNCFARQRGGQDLIIPGHWVYRAMSELEVELGRTTFADQGPVSIEELKSYMEDIDYELLSPIGKKQYERIFDYFKEKNWSLNASAFSVGIEPTFDLEGYFKSNGNIPWVYDYTKREPFLDFPIKLGLGDIFTVYMGVAAMQNYTIRERNDNYINECFRLESFDAMLTHQNYFSAGYNWDGKVGINFRFGAGTQSLGDTLMPSIIMSEYLTDAPYGNIKVYSNFFEYNANITQVNANTFYYTHRLEVRFFKKIQFTVVEGVLPYQAFDLRFLSPLAIYHAWGLFKEYDCSSFLGFKLNITPCKYLKIYGLYAQNEHSMGSERSGGNYCPEGLGFQTGVKSTIPTRFGYVNLNGEFYYTTPYFLIKQNPNVSFAKVFKDLETGDVFYQRIGNPLGSDTMAFAVSAGFENPGKWSVDLIYNFAACGEFSKNGIFKKSNWQVNGSYDPMWNTSIYRTDPSDPEKFTGTYHDTPHGVVEYQNSIYIKGKYHLYDWLEFYCQPCYTFVFNAGNVQGNFQQGFEIALGCKFYLTKLVNNLPECDMIK